MNTLDPGVITFQTTIFHSMQSDFDRACEFLSAYISNRHAEAQNKYANHHGTDVQQRQNESATGSNGDRGGRGQGQGGRSGQRGDRGRGRGGRGRANGRTTRAYINNVGITDLHRNYTSAEWEKLGTMRSVVLQMRDGGGRGVNDNRSITNSTTNRTTSGVSASEDNNNNNNTTNDASVASLQDYGSRIAKRAQFWPRGSLQQ